MSMKLEISGKRLKELREKWELSQEYIANFCGTSRQQICRLEKDEEHRTSKELLNSLSDVLRCTPDYLQGYVDNPDEIRTCYIDKITTNNGDKQPVRQERIIRKMFQAGDFRDSIIHKIYVLPPSKRSALYTLIDCLKNADDSQVEAFKRICIELFSYTPKYEKKILCVQDFVYCKISDEILPNIEEEAYQFIFSNYAPELESCKMEEANFSRAINQNLGDFQKETKQKLQLKIKNAVIPNKHLSSNDHYFTLERVKETVDYISKCIMTSINNQLDSSVIDQYLPHTKTSTEREELMIKLQKHLSLEIKNYSQPIIKDILTFFKEKEYLKET